MLQEQEPVVTVSVKSFYPELSVVYPVERNGSGVELRTLDYENPASNPVLQC